MKNILLWLLLCFTGGLGYLYMTDNPIVRHAIFPPPPPTPEPISPEVQIRGLISQSPIPASALAQLCSAHPDVAQRLLSNRLLSVQGAAREFHIFGVDSDRLNISLDDSTDRQIIVSYDLSKYEKSGVQAKPRRRGKFVKGGPEVHFVSMDGKARVLLYKEGQDLTKQVRFDSINSRTVMLIAQD